MYRRVRVENFRGIPDLTVDDLARVNLFVGPNNAGKTSLLEALLLLQSPGAPDITTVVNQARGLLEPFLGELAWNNFFPGMKPDRTITLEGTDVQGIIHTLSISLTRPEIETVSPQSDGLPNRAGLAVTGIASMLAPSVILHFRYKADDAQPVETQARLTGQIQEISRAELDRGGTAFLPVGPSLSPQSLATLFTQVQDMGELDGVIDSLRPQLSGLRTLSLGFTEGRPFIRAHIEGLDRPLPLQFLGGGTGRLAAILFVTLTIDGLVLIDEIDTGIYYQNLLGAWQSVDAASARRNVQIFATTHSLECVRAALLAFEGAHESALRIYRIEHSKGRIRAVGYDQQTAAASLEMGLEVR